MHPEADSLCRSMLAVVDAIPSDVPWHVVTTDHQSLIFVADSRDEASTLEMEAIAGQFGDVVASECFHSRRIDPKPIIGCLVSIPAGSDPDETAGRLRGAYAISTNPPNDEPGFTGPF